MDILGQIRTDEKWERIIGWEDYEISNHGRLRSLKKRAGGKLLKLTDTGEGYKTAVLYKGSRKDKRQVLIHRLVGENFLHPPSEELLAEIAKTRLGVAMINHKDGDRSNNHFSNLEWCTPSHNNSEAYRLGREQKRGGEYHLSKLTEQDVTVILIYRQQGKTHAEIASLLGVSRQTISSIFQGYTWSSYTGIAKKVQKSRSKTTSIAEC